jgi:hypothetical protein
LVKFDNKNDTFPSKIVVMPKPKVQIVHLGIPSDDYQVLDISNTDSLRKVDFREGTNIGPAQG